MITKSDLEPLIAANLAGFQVCAGYLNCILMQSVAGRPLAPEEMAKAAELAANRVVEHYTRTLRHMSDQARTSNQ